MFFTMNFSTFFDSWLGSIDKFRFCLFSLLNQLYHADRFVHAEIIFKC